MENIKVSIVVPVYNQEKYLNTAIKSLIAQTYSNIEIIIVNDGSKDTSADIISFYQNIDDRIVVINKENGGLVDATIEGISKATGTYLAFLDPDDNIGEEFISNFIEQLDQPYDFVAAGFYYDKNGILWPYELKENKVVQNTEIKSLQERFLLGDENSDIPRDIFISRWNKIYKMSCARKVIEFFSAYKNCSLGEDTLFTYFVLLNSTIGKVIKAPNCYFYNVGNQNSMMKSGQVENHVNKARTVFFDFSKLLKSSGHSDDQAYALYYHLISSLFARLATQDLDKFDELYRVMRKDEVYKNSIRLLLKKSNSWREKYKYRCELWVNSPMLYNLLTIKARTFLRKIKNLISNVVFFEKNITSNGIDKTLKLVRFRTDRKNAFEDLIDKLPLIESRIQPYIQEFEGAKTDLEHCSIEKNIFIFWWDGFENAPEIVCECLKSVRNNFDDYNIIEISKYNYDKYTDINPEIIKNFMAGNISVQTFSDILRFNLLKNNGGIWIDSTIYFFEKYDICVYLNDKSFESLDFRSSKNFLSYKNEDCSWSGYFIASRKNGVLVSAMDKIFEKYYLQYKTYTTYFFIDAAFMICKINHVDDDALNKIHYNSGDMFLLGKIMHYDYSDFYVPLVKKIPQKLQWKFHIDSNPKSVYGVLISKEGK